MEKEIIFTIYEKSIDRLGGDWVEYRPKRLKSMDEKYIYFKKKVCANKSVTDIFLYFKLRYNIETKVFKLVIRGNFINWVYGGRTDLKPWLINHENCIKRLAMRTGLSEEMLWKANQKL
ncbi:hypothetical protein R1T16_13110 [Flavobacterium sp. DG1-102-2]|uniref:hypothetical protein n=1 Tax=Flavobacterium sp. DG1-102-2 TaxID=3081663 RepID=UPI00294A446E|nr:hypothetical protein [Flavobacterium sp. DG1-102-2]MDV6169368.1 hypothetical protein [Flavobacterium sp. DG1-102-2]